MTESDDLVSIIIPVYNSERFLAESIESAINQTYKNIEVIAVNDGSTDKSLEILNKFSDKIAIISHENLGLAKAVNSAITKMKGRWLKWLSPDDILALDAVQILVEEAKKLPQNTILYSNWEIIDEKGKKLRDFFESNYNDLSDFDFNVRLLDGQQININTVLFPALLFEKGCMMRALDDTTVIDYDFFLRSGILYGMNFHLVEKNLLKYRIHERQTSHRNILQSIKYLNQIKKDILSTLDDDTSSKYYTALEKFSKDKKITKKTMVLGLKIIEKLFPKSVSDKMLVFYLNKIRSRR